MPPSSIFAKLFILFFQIFKGIKAIYQDLQIKIRGGLNKKKVDPSNRIG